MNKMKMIMRKPPTYTLFHCKFSPFFFRYTIHWHKELHFDDENEKKINSFVHSSLSTSLSSRWHSHSWNLLFLSFDFIFSPEEFFLFSAANPGFASLSGFGFIFDLKLGFHRRTNYQTIWMSLSHSPIVPQSNTTTVMKKKKKICRLNSLKLKSAVTV